MASALVASGPWSALWVYLGRPPMGRRLHFPRHDSSQEPVNRIIPSTLIVDGESHTWRARVSLAGEAIVTMGVTGQVHRVGNQEPPRTMARNMRGDTAVQRPLHQGETRAMQVCQAITPQGRFCQTARLPLCISLSWGKCRDTNPDPVLETMAAPNSACTTNINLIDLLATRTIASN